MPFIGELKIIGQHFLIKDIDCDIIHLCLLRFIVEYALFYQLFVICEFVSVFSCNLDELVR